MARSRQCRGPSDRSAGASCRHATLAFRRHFTGRASLVAPAAGQAGRAHSSLPDASVCRSPRQRNPLDVLRRHGLGWRPAARSRRRSALDRRSRCGQSIWSPETDHHRADVTASVRRTFQPLPTVMRHCCEPWRRAASSPPRDRYQPASPRTRRLAASWYRSSERCATPAPNSDAITNAVVAAAYVQNHSRRESLVARRLRSR